jgi:exopolysaccharide biosynthesis polyprenyl glycosylphosphotransferase
MRGQDPQGQHIQSTVTGSSHTSSLATNHAMRMADRFGLAEVDGELETAEGAFRSHPVLGFSPSTDYLEELAELGFPNIRTRMYSMGKRLFDITFAFVAIALTSPLLVVIAIAIKMSSPGPVFFTQERVGKNGAIFHMLKFRTMRVADKGYTDTAWRAVDDPRRTALGGLLRRTSLDELPQFFNVVRGEMSVVGPRPERPFFVEKFAMEIPKYELRHFGEVGITGWAQIHGYRGDTCIETRVTYDLEYLEKWSLGLDLTIVWRTIRGIFYSGHE